MREETFIWLVITSGTKYTQTQAIQSELEALRQSYHLAKKTSVLARLLLPKIMTKSNRMGNLNPE